MNTRELLQKEIWSKETTRKIFRVFGFVGIGLVVVACGLTLWVFVEVHWLTSGERIAAKAVLPQIDVLRNSDAISDAEFDDRVKKAQSGVDAAGQKIRTARDRQVYVMLSVYLDEITTRRSDLKFQKYIESRPSFKRSEQSKELRLKADEMNRNLQKVFSEDCTKFWISKSQESEKSYGREYRKSNLNQRPGR